MTISIMQPYFMPYIGYWQMVNLADTFVLLDDVNYIKKGWINRNRVLVNGEPHTFTLPLYKASQNKLICETCLSDSFEIWQDKFIQTLTHGYKCAPYFDSTMRLIDAIFSYPERNLALFLGNSIQVVADYLNIGTKFVYSSSISKEQGLKGQDKIIAICEELKTDKYVNAIGGKTLYNKSSFSKKRIELCFIESLPLEYQQFNNQFYPWLSFIDILMFNGIPNIIALLSKFKLT